MNGGELIPCGKTFGWSYWGGILIFGEAVSKKVFLRSEAGRLCALNFVPRKIYLLLFKYLFKKYCATGLTIFLGRTWFHWCGGDVQHCNVPFSRL
ncbi:hypothetical protein B7R78_0004720 [Ralstonia solanacearum]|uniref:hypothetical protein n=1 Tax=Ralstonia solanacearum TaxID=305 RepID=UPI00114494F9|nr:hypothetical protein [Ralstonia solanacearum]MBT1536465.1 hypothetical protein [Ralstonia solanacearum]